MPGTITNEGCEIAFDVQGSGPCVLWIQGVGVHGDGWRPQIESLKDVFTCITFDNRGIGKSVPANQPVSVERMARDALAVLDSVTLENAHVVGHSLGGLVAQQLALRVPERIKSLTLMCTFGNGGTVAPLTWRMMWYGMLAQFGTQNLRRKGFLRLLLPPSQSLDSVNLDQLAELFGHDLADQPAIVPEQLRAMRQVNLLSRLGELTGVPSLVISAEHDLIAPPALGKELAAAIPQSQYREIDHAAHGLPITHAERVNALVREHLSRAP